jgi:hypothetical protein
MPVHCVPQEIIVLSKTSITSQLGPAASQAAFLALLTWKNSHRTSLSRKHSVTSFYKNTDIQRKTAHNEKVYNNVNGYLWVVRLWVFSRFAWLLILYSKVDFKSKIGALYLVGKH